MVLFFSHIFKNMEHLRSLGIYVNIFWGRVHILLNEEKSSSLPSQPPTHWFIKETNKEAIYHIHIPTYKYTGRQWYGLLYKEISSPIWT